MTYETDEIAAASTWILLQMLTTANTPSTLNQNQTELFAMVQDPPPPAPASQYRIFESIMPSGSVYPTIVISFYAGMDVNASGTVRIMSNVEYMVTAMSMKSFYEASQVMRRAASLIQGQNGYVTVDGVSYYVAGCYRKMPIARIEEKEQQTYYHVGGRYGLNVQPYPAATLP